VDAVPGRRSRSFDISVDDLRYLLAVARTGRLVAAATLVGVDHTTVRRRLDRLEAALGTRLLDRGADGWELTSVGREIVERAEPLEHVVESVIAAASGAEDALRGTVRVVAPDGFGSLFVAPAVARVQAQHPALVVELVTSTRPLSLRGSGFDIAITVGANSASRLTAEELAPYSLRLYATRGYLAAHPRIRDAGDLRDHRLIFYVDALLTVQELDLTPELAGMRVTFASTNVFAQLEATRAGAGIGLLHAFMGERDPELVPVLPGEVEFELRYSMAVRRASAGLDAVAVVRDAIREEARARSHELLP